MDPLTPMGNSMIGIHVVSKADGACIVSARMGRGHSMDMIVYQLYNLRHADWALGVGASFHFK